MSEPELINLFVDITGESENTARSVLIYLDILERDYFPARNGDTEVAAPEPGYASKGEFAERVV